MAEHPFRVFINCAHCGRRTQKKSWNQKYCLGCTTQSKTESARVHDPHELVTNKYNIPWSGMDQYRKQVENSERIHAQTTSNRFRGGRSDFITSDRLGREYVMQEVEEEGKDVIQ